MKKIIVLIFIVAFFTSEAQTVRQPLAVRYAGLGAYSTQFVDVFSGSSNQAALAQIKSGGFGAYTERRFLLQELNQYSAIVAMPTSSGTFAIQGDYFGFNSYNESQLGIAYGRKISSQLDVGVKLNYSSVQIAGYGNAGAVNFEAGSIFHLSEKVHAGIHIFNPVGGKFNKNTNEKLASAYKFGMGYEPSNKFFLSTEIVKQENLPVNVNVGMQYNIQSTILFRAGISTHANNSFAGLGFKLGQLRLDVNATVHPQLGVTPGVLLLYQFGKDK